MQRDGSIHGGDHERRGEKPLGKPQIERAAGPTGREPRVATLLPSATEIVCALGMEHALVGVSHECDWPQSVRGKPVLTSTKIFSKERSATIDRDVRELLKTALAVYDIDVERLRETAPDVIVTQDLCDVCAVSLDAVKRAAAEVLGPHATIVNLHPTRLADITDDVRKVARALGCTGRGEELVRSLEARIDAVRVRSGARSSTPNVLTIEWLDPVMVGGTWMPELVALAGGRALVTSPGDHAPTLTKDELARLDPAPDVVVVKPCGYVLERTREELDTLLQVVAGLDWPAVRERSVWVADGNAYFNRPGPRIVESLEILAAIVHPQLFADFAKTHRLGFERAL